MFKNGQTYCKNLQEMLQDFESMFNYFEALWIKGLKLTSIRVESLELVSHFLI